MDSGLTLHSEKTRIIDCHLGVEDSEPTGATPRRHSSLNFLGFNFKMVPRTDCPSLPKVKVTTSEVSIKKTVALWPHKARVVMDEVSGPEARLQRLLDFIRTSVGGFLAYQDHLSDTEGLLGYLEAIKPVIYATLRKAKATNHHLNWLNAMMVPENIPALIEAAKRRGRWHKELHGNWRTDQDATWADREDDGGIMGSIPSSRLVDQA